MSGINDIRQTFLGFFGDRDHTPVESGSLIPHNDPSLMFVNSGMVQFKNVFTGLEKRDYRRAVTTQKCVRAGGKHNDLDNVGYTYRHHTFFEMLGNFSFGDYFKDVAIELAWQLLTKELGLDTQRLIFTVYGEDDQAFDLWRKISGISENRILRIYTADNFWSMADTGPCGPCSEIFYDHGDHITGSLPGSPEGEGDRFVEIWNLVFMQYEQINRDKRINLPHPSVDTGMGIERMAAVLGNTCDNYRTNLFQQIIAMVEEVTHVKETESPAPSHRIIADHLRSSCFLIAEGILPSNEGRGYVLRRIMRRAMRHAHLLRAKEPVMWQLVPVMIAEMGGAYPELVRAQALITETLKLEETNFHTTLDKGLHILDDQTARLNPGDKLDGKIAFKLYDTYGFPLDLTQDTLRDRQISVDHSGFEAEMAKQRDKARASWVGAGGAHEDAIWFDLRQRLESSEFVGYETDELQGEVQAIVVDNKIVDKAISGEQCLVIFNQTPFYAEAGGQVGDTGQLLSNNKVIATVEDTRKRGKNLFTHQIKLLDGELKPGAAVTLRIDAKRRQALRLNHSATHLLHQALRQVLGKHVTQKGSLVAPDRLRFDFSHPKPLTGDEIWRVEKIINQIIRQNTRVSIHYMALNDALKTGALALFDEKYADEVRVIFMGQSIEEACGDQPYSVELCGGTHVNRTGEIAITAIISEGGVAAGVRRIEALTGEQAFNHLILQRTRVRAIADALSIGENDLIKRIETLQQSNRALERKLTASGKQTALDQAMSRAEKIGDVSYLSGIVKDLPPRELRGLIDDAKGLIKNAVIVFIAISGDDKVAVAVGVTPDLTHRFNAAELVRLAAQELGGKSGGGRADMAQAGGRNPNKASTALDVISRELRRLTSP